MRAVLSTVHSRGSIRDGGGEAGRMRGAPRPRLQCACASWAWLRRPGAHAGQGGPGPWKSESCSSLRSRNWGDQMRTENSKAFRAPWEIETHGGTRCAPDARLRTEAAAPGDPRRPAVPGGPARRSPSVPASSPRRKVGTDVNPTVLRGFKPALGNIAIYLSFVSPVSLFSSQNCRKLNIYLLYRDDMLG